MIDLPAGTRLPVAVDQVSIIKFHALAVIGPNFTREINSISKTYEFFSQPNLSEI